jgi:4,5-DOPA dioxygenase extradiol
MLPTVFVSHGSPMHAVIPGRAGDAWRDLGRRLPRPRAVLVASAHWETELPMISLAQRPETIHDFEGFPPELSRLRYPAPGAPEVARQAIELLRDAGLSASGNGCRGLDHGAWVPMLHLFPAADVPVTQLSVQPSLGAGHHIRLGRALSPLRERGVLIVGSGHVTHNLHEWARHARRFGLAPRQASPEPYVQAFRHWLGAALQAADDAALANWREAAPHARRAHPTDEHFLPLPLAYGAAGPQPRTETIDSGVDAGVLAMDAFVFWPRT